MELDETGLSALANFADAAVTMGGAWAGEAIGLAVMISSLGALNGWTLMMGQVPMAAARDGLFPAVFGRLSARGVPAFGMILSVSLATALLLIQASGAKNLVAFYRVIVNLSTMTAVVPYVFCSLAGSILAWRKAGLSGLRGFSAVEVVAFAFSNHWSYGVLRGTTRKADGPTRSRRSCSPSAGRSFCC